jgi:hypothetical protein
MGRPVNKKYFGPLNTTGTDGYWNIPVNAYINGALHTDAYITSQSATNEFHVATEDGLFFAIARLTNKQPADLVLGEMCIMAVDSENNDYFIKKISNRTTIDFDNNKFTWALAESGAVTSMTITPIGEVVISPPISPTGAAKYIIPLLGQSNSKGKASIPAEDYPTGVYMMDQSGTITVATSPLPHVTSNVGESGFQVQFCKDLIAANPTAEVLLVPVSEGGTGFIDDRWNPSNDLYENAVSQTLLAKTKAGWTDATIPCVLWHQGEKDATNTAPGYIADFRAMVTAYRGAVSIPALPFITGDLADQYIGGAAMLGYETLKDDSGIHHARYVNLATSDGIHFNLAAMTRIGSLYYAAAVLGGAITDPQFDTPIVVQASQVFFNDVAASTFTFSPTWNGSATRAVIVTWGRSGGTTPTCTVGGVPAIRKLSGRVNSNDWCYVFETAETSGNVVFAHGTSTIRNMCAVVQISGDEPLYARIPTLAADTTLVSSLTTEGNSLATVMIGRGKALPTYGLNNEIGTQVNANNFFIALGTDQPAATFSITGGSEGMVEIFRLRDAM